MISRTALSEQNPKQAPRRVLRLKRKRWEVDEDSSDFVVIRSKRLKPASAPQWDARKPSALISAFDRSLTLKPPSSESLCEEVRVFKRIRRPPDCGHSVPGALAKRKAASGCALGKKKKATVSGSAKAKSLSPAASVGSLSSARAKKSLRTEALLKSTRDFSSKCKTRKSRIRSVSPKKGEKQKKACVSIDSEISGGGFVHRDISTAVLCEASGLSPESALVRAIDSLKCERSEGALVEYLRLHCCGPTEDRWSLRREEPSAFDSTLPRHCGSDAKMSGVQEDGDDLTLEFEEVTDDYLEQRCDDCTVIERMARGSRLEQLEASAAVFYVDFDSFEATLKSRMHLTDEYQSQHRFVNAGVHYGADGDEERGRLRRTAQGYAYDEDDDNRDAEDFYGNDYGSPDQSEHSSASDGVLAADYGDAFGYLDYGFGAANAGDESPDEIDPFTYSFPSQTSPFAAHRLATAGTHAIGSSADVGMADAKEEKEAEAFATQTLTDEILLQM